MHRLKPLPTYLEDRYRGWKDTSFQKKKTLLETLANEGQKPKAMVISCSDSRVQMTDIFQFEEGEVFVHRNVASLVPPCDVATKFHGTPAAVEYGVTALGVEHLIVMGHSQCGGAKGCLDMCKGNAPALEDPGSFVGQWVSLLKPKFGRVADIEDEAEQVRLMERLAVEMSIENLFTYPFIAERHAAGTLSLHGLWFDIGSGTLEAYSPENGKFLAV